MKNYIIIQYLASRDPVFLISMVFYGIYNLVQNNIQTNKISNLFFKNSIIFLKKKISRQFCCYLLAPIEVSMSENKNIK